MTRRGKIIAIFRELGFTLRLDEFEDRIVAQKINCLVQLRGVRTGYPCGIYVRGPYSPALAHELYDHTDDFSSHNTQAELDDREMEIVHELGEVFDLQPSLLEIGSTYGYFIQAEKDDPLEALRKVKKIKSFFSEAQIAVGVSKAKQFLVKPTAADLEEIRSEIEPWQRAAIRSMKE